MEHSITTASPPRAAVIGTAAGLVGVAAGLVTIAVPELVDSAPAQLALAARDLGIAALLAALWTRGAAGRSALGRIGVAGGVLAMAGLAAMEVVSVVARDSGLIGTGYGLATLSAGVFLILAGVAVLRARTWTGPRRYLPLALGGYVFVPLTPAIVAGFTAGQLALAGWMLLFAVLGRAMAAAPDRVAS
jgi:hypothetical protein